MLYKSTPSPVSRQALGTHALFTSALLQVQSLAPHNVPEMNDYLTFFSALGLRLGLAINSPGSEGWAQWGYDAGLEDLFQVALMPQDRTSFREFLVAHAPDLREALVDLACMLLLVYPRNEYEDLALVADYITSLV